jgi:endonuclease/exonuclease/phosphatase family metal-dependent hydrolase
MLQIKTLWIVFILVFKIHLVSAQTKTGVSIKVMSFNIQHGENDQEESNLVDVLKILRTYQPDLVAFQAIDSFVMDGKLQFQIRRLAVQTGMYYAYAPSEKFVFGTQGVAILSKWEIEKKQLIHLPTAQSNKDTKSMLCGLIRPNKNLSFRFCSCSLDQTSPMDRGLQAAYVNRILESSIQPIIVGMDMGAKPQEQPYSYFKTKWKDVGQSSQDPTRSNGAAGDRKDYVFVLQNSRFKISNYKVITRYPHVSNRFPIMANIEFW